MRRPILRSSWLILALAGCAAAPTQQGGGGGSPLDARRTDLQAAAPPPGAATVEEFDTTTPAEQAAARALPSVAEEQLGRTVASLGDPADPGFWALTPLVSQVRPGRLVDPRTGFSVMVELRPRDGGGGTEVSLPALRALGVPLTALPEIVVYSSAP
jgi:hypothetical protein